MNSAWKVRYSDRARKQLKKLDKAAAERIVRTLMRDIERLGDPRSWGEPMTGNWTGYWRYRVGNHRAICHIEDETVTVFVIQIAHRREVYRGSPS